jgi:hypothetical protein
MLSLLPGPNCGTATDIRADNVSVTRIIGWCTPLHSPGWEAGRWERSVFPPAPEPLMTSRRRQDLASAGVPRPGAFLPGLFAIESGRGDAPPRSLERLPSRHVRQGFASSVVGGVFGGSPTNVAMRTTCCSSPTLLALWTCPGLSRKTSPLL